MCKQISTRYVPTLRILLSDFESVAAIEGITLQIQELIRWKIAGELSISGVEIDCGKQLERFENIEIFQVCEQTRK